MSPAIHVRTQTWLMLVLYAFIVAARGDALVLPTAIIVGGGVLITASFAADYYRRLWRRLHVLDPQSGQALHIVSENRRREDKLMALDCLLSYGPPLGLGIAFLAGLRFDGLLFSSQAATVACWLPLAAVTAVVTSSGVDWYLIRPFQTGVLNEPLCYRDASAPDRDQRRAYAKWWITHRAICEGIAYPAVALTVAIISAALTETVDSDRVLQIALGSFIGASTAFALVSYLRPRSTASWEYALEQSAGLGMWADGVDKNGKSINGFVRDVSVSPGIQLCRTPADPDFVPLEHSSSAQARPDLEPLLEPDAGSLCPGLCLRWVERCDRYFKEIESGLREPETERTHPAQAQQDADGASGQAAPALPGPDAPAATSR
jgi:hypothetical protein